MARRVHCHFPVFSPLVHWLVLGTRVCCQCWKGWSSVEVLVQLDVIKSSDTLDGGVLDCGLSSLGFVMCI